MVEMQLFLSIYNKLMRIVFLGENSRVVKGTNVDRQKDRPVDTFFRCALENQSLTY
jgi:hypothetical protein